jgi:DNA polymerase
MSSEKLNVLYDEYKNCQKCPSLCESRSQVVFGIGNPSADLLVISETPGIEEDKTGIPLVGQSGKILDWYLCQYFGLTSFCEDFSLKGGFRKSFDWPSHEDTKKELCKFTFYTSSILCRPEDGRDPSHDELITCKERLHKLIYTVDPIIILAVGKIALESLTGKRGVSILKSRGTLTDITIPGVYTDIKYPVFSILKPEYLMRSGFSENEDSPWTQTHKDIKKLYDLVNEIKKWT